jgi:hypothetical protein
VFQLYVVGVIKLKRVSSECREYSTHEENDKISEDFNLKALEEEIAWKMET